jgi:hypothetical protein
MKRFWVFALGLVFLWGIAVAPAQAALTPGTVYTITIQKMNSNGSLTDVSTTEATADSNGKLSFSLTTLPTNSDCNFIVFILKLADGTVVRKGFVPAPPAGDTNLMGINTLSTVQTNAVLSAGEKIGTDDPIAFAYLITLLRSDGATVSDAALFAELGKYAIVGTGGFEATLTSSGVTSTQLANFKSYLIYNPTAGKKTLRDLTASFKTAVDSGNATTAKQEMQKAGGFMADVFMDAASSAGIDMNLILAAHDAAGVVAEAHSAITNQLTSGVKSSMDQSMTAFFQRIAAIKVKNEYTKALTTLNASGTQVDTFNSAVAVMMTAMQAIDSDYADFYNNPQAYCAAQGKSFSEVQAETSARYQAAFSGFQDAITSSNADILTMKTKVATAFEIPVGQLPSDFGKYYSFGGTQKNWPIPQTVMVTWLADSLIAGGTFTYTRPADVDTVLPVPSTMAWIGSCSDPNYMDQGSCTFNGETWTSQTRRTYPSGMPAAFKEYMKLQEDVQIAENIRYSLYSGGQPTRQQEKQVKLDFLTNLVLISGWISGKTDAATDITTDQKKAIVKLLMQPSMD